MVGYIDVVAHPPVSDHIKPVATNIVFISNAFNVQYSIQIKANFWVWRSSRHIGRVRAPGPNQNAESVLLKKIRESGNNTKFELKNPQALKLR